MIDDILDEACRDYPDVGWAARLAVDGISIEAIMGVVEVSVRLHTPTHSRTLQVMAKAVREVAKAMSAK